MDEFWDNVFTSCFAFLSHFLSLDELKFKQRQLLQFKYCLYEILRLKIEFHLILRRLF